MKNMVRKLRVLIMVSALFLPVLLMAQDPGGFDDDVIDNEVPFDGGVSVLVASGIAYGIKKVRDGRKRQAEQD
jgi:hypothetical protein